MPALSHGGTYARPTTGGEGGPQAAPGFGDPNAAPTRWETWWGENREGLLKIAERVDALAPVVATPAAGELVTRPDAATTRAARAAAVRGDVLGHLLYALNEGDFDVRSSAAIALGKLGSGASGPRAHVAGRLRDCSRQDTRGEVRRAALLGLGIMGRTEDIPFLGDFLTQRAAETDRERAMAALAIGLIGGDDAAAFLAFFIERLRTPSAR